MFHTTPRSLVALSLLCGASALASAQEDCRPTTGIITSANGLRLDTVSVDGTPEANTITVVPTYEVFEKTAVILADDDYTFVEDFEDSDSVDFTNYAPGKYNIFLVTYSGNWNDSIAVGASVYTVKYSSECWLLSNNEIIVYAEGTPDAPDSTAFEPLPCDTVVSTGFVYFPDGEQIDTFDVSDGQPDIIEVVPTTYDVNPGAKVATILTDREYNIVEVFPETTTFDLDAFPSDKYNVFLLTYTGTLNEDIDGQSVYEAQYTDACWLISNNELIVYARAEQGCDRFVTTGIITNAAGERIDTITVGDRKTDGILVVPTYEVLAETAVVVADANYTFLAAYPNVREVDFEHEGFGPGKYNIFLVTFTGKFNDSIAVGASVYTITYSSACYLISNNEIILYAEGYDAPALEGQSDLAPGLEPVDITAYQDGRGGDLQVTIADGSEANGVSVITLIDSYGRPVQSVQVGEQPRYSLPTGGLNSGIYVVTAQTARGITSRQVLIQ